MDTTATKNTTKEKPTKYIVRWYEESADVFDSKEEAIKFIKDELMNKGGVNENEIEVFKGTMMQFRSTITLED